MFSGAKTIFCNGFCCEGNTTVEDQQPIVGRKEVSAVWDGAERRNANGYGGFWNEAQQVRCWVWTSARTQPCLEAKHSQLVLLQIKLLTAKPLLWWWAARTGSIQAGARGDKASTQHSCLSAQGHVPPAHPSALRITVPIKPPRGGITHLGITILHWYCPWCYSVSFPVPLFFPQICESLKYQLMLLFWGRKMDWMWVSRQVSHYSRKENTAQPWIDWEPLVMLEAYIS